MTRRARILVAVLGAVSVAAGLAIGCSASSAGPPQLNDYGDATNQDTSPTRDVGADKSPSPDAHADSPVDAPPDVPTDSPPVDIAPCVIGGDVLYLNGDPGEFIHPGADTIVNGTFVATASPASQPTTTIQVSITPADAGQGLDWETDFSSEQLGQPLAVQAYANAARYPFEPDASPGLSVYGNGRGCNTLTGSFTIYVLDVTANVTDAGDGGEAGAGEGGVNAFTASFVQYCEAEDAALHGCVHVGP